MTWEPFLTVCVYVLALCSLSQGTSIDRLYFSDSDDIMLLTNGSSMVVIPDLTLVDIMDCNACDRMIYWVDHRSPVAVRRGLPNDPFSVQTVLDRDLAEVRGLAVDWIGNNIYISHSDRIEVASCDGVHRKVLKNKIVGVGPITIDLTRGYLYYTANVWDIHRIMLNGNQDILVHRDFTPPVSSGFQDIELDPINSILYWTVNPSSEPPDGYGIRSFNLTSNAASNFISTGSARPHKLILYQGTLYWTEPRVHDVSEAGVDIEQPGAVYSTLIETAQTVSLLQNNSLSPHDLCYFFEPNMSGTGSCSESNGGCAVLCLTIPAADGSTQPECACPTGIAIKEDGISCNTFPDHFLLFTQTHNAESGSHVSHTDLRMISLDNPLMFVDTLTPITVPMASARFIAYDFIRHHVYWSQIDPPMIQRASLDGSGVPETIIQTSIALPESLAIDPYSHTLYWVDSALDQIQVLGLTEGRGFRRVVVQTGRKPQGLALDLTNRLMYWTELELESPRVEQCRMDGTECRAILRDLTLPSGQSLIREPATITVDPLTGYVYFAETSNDIVLCWDGSRHTEIPFRGTDIAGLTVNQGYLYWTDRSGVSDRTMGRLNLDTHARESVLERTGGLHGILAVNENIPAVPSVCQDCEQLCLYGNGSTNPCVCANNFTPDISNPLTCSDPPASMFVSVGRLGVVRFSQYSSSSEQWILDDPLPYLDITASRMDIDFSTNTLYWISIVDMLIYRSAVDNPTALPQPVVHCCVGEIRDLAVDWFGRNLYWLDSGKRVIELSKLDGSGRTELYRIPASLGRPSILTLDPLRGHLYWCPETGGRIYRWRMDGDSPVDSGLFWESNARSVVFGLSMNYTSEAGVRDQLYFITHPLSDTSMAVMYSTEVDSEEAVLSGLQRRLSMRMITDFQSLEGDPYVLQIGQHLRLSSVLSSGHDDSGQNFNNVVNFLGIGLAGLQPDNISSFIIAHHSLQPGVHECSVNNKDCGEEALCLVETGVRGECVCSTLESSRLHVGADGTTTVDCSLATSHDETFLLLATEDSVQFLPFDRSSTSLIRPLPLPSVSSISTLAYDAVDQSVLITDNGTLHRVALDSSFDHAHLLPNIATVTALAYDWIGGHIFTTHSQAFQIELTTINGQEAGSVLEIGVRENRQLPLIGELAIHPTGQRLYWTTVKYFSVLNQTLGYELHYIDLSNPQTELSINLGGRVIRNLTVDTRGGHVCWVNVSVSDRSRVGVECWNPQSQVITEITHTSRVAGLAVTTVASQLHIFWYNDEEGVLYLHSDNQTERYRNWQSGGRLIGLLAHTVPMLSVEQPCLADQRPCTHYCVSSGGSNHQCGCPAHTTLDSTSTSCSSVNCGSLWSCGSNTSECFPQSYRCDHIRHCSNGRDEDCNCSVEEFACYLSEGRNECVAMVRRCDGTPDCTNAEDEAGCCVTGQFGCYVEDDSYRPLGGTAPPFFQCFSNESLCDGMSDCLNATIDEPDTCPTQPPTTSPPPDTMLFSERNITIIITSIVVILVASMIIIILCCYVTRQLAKRKQANLASNRMSRALNFDLDKYTRAKYMDSPQPRVDSVSDYYSQYSGASGNTHTTQVGSQASGHKRHSAGMVSTDPSNPPPSPITTFHSPPLTDIEDDISVFSQSMMMEFPIPPVPNPSLNYDQVSDNLSYSVSQSQFPATISGRANPLMQQPRQQYQNGGYHYPQSNGGYMIPKRGQLPSNGKHPCPSSHYNHYPPSHPRKELDSLARTETESTVSMTTVSTENHDEYGYDEAMSYAPPGRPPSPVTVVSDYHPRPMSPDSTLSELSDEEPHQT